jgi:hypothetical protein
MGDKAIVSFRFANHPEFVEIGSEFFFREGTTRGVGTIVDVLSLKNDPNKDPARVRRPRYTRIKNRKKKKEKEKEKERSTTV